VHTAEALPVQQDVARSGTRLVTGTLPAIGDQSLLHIAGVTYLLEGDSAWFGHRSL
jgi:hypothetical protein